MPANSQIVKSVSVTGLQNSGRHVQVVVNDSSWTALPASPLTDRNAIAVQNNSNSEIKINHDPGVATYVGMSIAPGAERTYDITDNIVIYGRVEAGGGPVTLDVEELS